MPFGGHLIQTILTITIGCLALAACGAERHDLRSYQSLKAQGRSGEDGSPAMALSWEMDCDSDQPSLDLAQASVAGLGSLRFPADGPRKLSVTYSGKSCPEPGAQRGRDIVLAFELSDAMAQIDPVDADGTCSRSRLLREWSQHPSSIGLSAIDGDVRFSIVLYSRLVLARVAGYHQTVDLAVQRLLATQRKPDLDSLICLGRGEVDLTPMASQVESLHANFGRDNASKELILIGTAQESSVTEVPESLSRLYGDSWIISGVVFGGGMPEWSPRLTDRLGRPSWSLNGAEVGLLPERLQAILKNQVRWQFVYRALKRPAEPWNELELTGEAAADRWQVPAISISDAGDNWGLEVQFRAIDRFGIAGNVYSAFLLW
jgi:hypothetical protein